ncbi:hypothetical protein D3C74_329750 [compost metagenome]
MAGLEQRLAQPLADGDGGVGHRVGAARDARLDLPEADLVGHRHDGLEARGARLLEVERGGLRRERRAQDRLADQVEVARVLEHRTADDLAQALALEAVAGHEPLEGGREHVLVAGSRVLPAGTRERDAVAAQDVGVAEGRGLLGGAGCGGGLLRLPDGHFGCSLSLRC